MAHKISCKKFSLLIEDFLDGILDGEELAEFYAHLETCEKCRSELNFVLTLRGMVSSSQEEIPDGLHERIITAVNEDIKESPRKKRKIFLRRTAVSAACAIICLSLSVIFALMPMWRKPGAGADIPKDDEIDSSFTSQVLSNDRFEFENEPEVFDPSESKREENSGTEISPSQTTAGSSSSTGALPDDGQPPNDDNSEPDQILPSTEAIATAPEATEPHPTETAPEATEPAATEPEAAEPEAAEPAATEVRDEEPSPPRDTAPLNNSVTHSKPQDGSAPEVSLNSAPGGYEITFALLIVSGLLAFASFVAFLISLSSVRNTNAKKESHNNEEDKK